jgi:hypothetical protein
VVRLDLHDHEAVVQHSDGRVARVPLTPDRPVADVTCEILDAVGGGASIDPTPQETHWTVPLDEDREHASYDAGQAERALTPAESRMNHCRPVATPVA